jgi:mono/diheme cytochrome c family protein
MRATTFFLGLLTIAACEARADDTSGKRIFDTHCAECHADGFGHPGTQRLGWNRGDPYAVLTTRKDLSADYIKQVVRRGLVEMPPFRPSEITDAELAQLSAYLAGKPAKAR